MSNKVRLAIAGASGRMGRMLIETASADSRFELVTALEQAGSDAVGRGLRELYGVDTAVCVSDDPAGGLAAVDCLIDFTRPAGTLAHLEICRLRGVSMVIGTTGFDDAGRLALVDAAREIPIVAAPNMSVGVNVVFKLLDTAARILAAGYDVEIVEAHHRNKVDAPSGTALRMGEVVADALQRDLAASAVYGREGVTGVRDSSTIGFATVRGGDIVGDHTVMFCGTGERVEISHKASSRMPYALGSMRAALFLQGRQKGLFDMQDVLGLR